MCDCVCGSGGGDGESGGEMKGRQRQSTSQLINNFSKWQGKKNDYKHGTEIYGGIYTESRKVASVMSDSLQPHRHTLPGSSDYGIYQARILEWVATPFSKGSSRPRDWT